MEHSRCRDWHGKKVRVKMALAFSRRKLVWLSGICVKQQRDRKQNREVGEH